MAAARRRPHRCVQVAPSNSHVSFKRKMPGPSAPPNNSTLPACTSYAIACMTRADGAVAGLRWAHVACAASAPARARTAAAAATSRLEECVFMESPGVRERRACANRRNGMVRAATDGTMRPWRHDGVGAWAEPGRQ
jgi:hypothetical protein